MVGFNMASLRAVRWFFLILAVGFAFPKLAYPAQSSQEAAISQAQSGSLVGELHVLSRELHSIFAPEPKCEDKSEPGPPTAQKNHWLIRQAKTGILLACAFMHAPDPETGARLDSGGPPVDCGKYADDYLAIASPSCPAGELGKSASDCTMGLAHLVSELTGAAQERYISIIEKINSRVEGLHQKNDPASRPSSLYELFLEASGGDKASAILLMAAPLMSGTAYLVEYLRASGRASPRLLAALQKWELSDEHARGPVDYAPTSLLSDIYPGIRTVPLQDQKQVPYVSEYHYWADAMMASEMRKRGYDEDTARSTATSTTVLYEAFMKVAQDLSKGRPLGRRYSDARKVIRFSDLGSQLGAAR